jgi:hypothetical protein
VQAAGERAQQPLCWQGDSSTRRQVLPASVSSLAAVSRGQRARLIVPPGALVLDEMEPAATTVGSLLLAA